MLQYLKHSVLSYYTSIRTKATGAMSTSSNHAELLFSRDTQWPIPCLSVRPSAWPPALPPARGGDETYPGHYKQLPDWHWEVGYGEVISTSRLAQAGTGSKAACSWSVTPSKRVLAILRSTNGYCNCWNCKQPRQMKQRGGATVHTCNCPRSTVMVLYFLLAEEYFEWVHGFLPVSQRAEHEKDKHTKPWLKQFWFEGARRNFKDDNILDYSGFHNYKTTLWRPVLQQKSTPFENMTFGDRRTCQRKSDTMPENGLPPCMH